MPLLEARQLEKRHQGAPALAGFSHAFAAGKITTVLGPSGSGKSTLLGLLAGLTLPDAGAVVFDGKDITKVPAERRNFGLVFQNYALFPHLTVAGNVEFGLRVRGVPPAERRRRVGETLERARIASLANRRVRELSGGEQQRVAIARAIAYHPSALFMDEPLSALDAGLREELRVELGALLRELKITTVYVTHDQAEALGLGDEMIILNKGKIEQTGPPREVYRRPVNAFVASFLGAANVVDGTWEDGELRLSFARIRHDASRAPGPCQVVVRPEDLELAEAEEEGAFAAELESTLFLGNRLRLRVNAGGERLTAEIQDGRPLEAGRPVWLRVRSGRAVVLPPGGG